MSFCSFNELSEEGTVVCLRPPILWPFNIEPQESILYSVLINERLELSIKREHEIMEVEKPKTCSTTNLIHLGCRGFAAFYFKLNFEESSEWRKKIG